MSDHDDIVIALRRIAQASELQSKQLFRASGLTVPQLLVMQAIARDGAPSTSSVARQVCVSQATVTRIIDRLERAGLVCRCKSSVDRRVINVRLTDSGHDRLARAPAPLQPGFVARFAALADWEQQMLKAALVRISRMMEGDGIDIAPVAAAGADRMAPTEAEGPGAGIGSFPASPSLDREDGAEQRRAGDMDGNAERRP